MAAGRNICSSSLMDLVASFCCPQPFPYPTTFFRPFTGLFESSSSENTCLWATSAELISRESAITYGRGYYRVFGQATNGPLCSPRKRGGIDPLLRFGIFRVCLISHGTGRDAGMRGMPGMPAPIDNSEKRRNMSPRDQIPLTAVPQKAASGRPAGDQT